MHEYDDALKWLLRKSARVAVREITGAAIENWLDVGVPKTRSLQLDLLGETADGALIHLELQSTNDPEMALRMAEYALGVYRIKGRVPRQFCLYVGEPRLRMPAELLGPGMKFEYTLIDVRNLDGEELLESAELGDNLIAILAQLRDHKDAIRRILIKAAALPKGAREAAIGHLLTFAGLRRLAALVKQEMEEMPIHIDLRENEVLGPPYIRGLEEGEEKGRREGEERGRKEGELNLLRRQVEKRFGTLPSWAEERLAAKPVAELEELGLRLLDAVSVEELLR
jgi:predicted transposase YdaD